MKPLLTEVTVQFITEQVRPLVDFHREGMDDKVTHDSYSWKSLHRLVRVCTELAADGKGVTLPKTWGWSWVR